MNTVAQNFPLRNAFEKGFIKSWTRSFCFRVLPTDEVEVAKRFPIHKTESEVWDELFESNDIEFILKYDYNGNAIHRMFFHLFPEERTGTGQIKSQPDLLWSATVRYQRKKLEDFLKAKA